MIDQILAFNEKMYGLERLFYCLLEAYGKRHWWPAKTPFEMMVGAILTQNTAWKNVERAIANFGDRLTPEFISRASCNELSEIIRPSGYYNQKSLKLKALVEWFSIYSFDINRAGEADGNTLRGELLSVRGIGRETADSILLYALDKPFFVVDAYTRRILKRLGYSVPDKYDDLRMQIEAGIPKDLYIYNEFHALIVEHAKRHCRKKPVCKGCPAEALCRKVDCDE